MTIRCGFSLTGGRAALADRVTITALAQRAEALGYDSVFVTDRMLIPVANTRDYPYSATGASRSCRTSRELFAADVRPCVDKA